MLDLIREFIYGRYAPHGYCLLWQPELVWTHVVSDSLIALSYFSIPLALIHFVRRRRDVEFGWMIWLFALFIMACGTSHLMSIWNLWHGDYGVEALVKVVTAVASVPTAILLWRLIPKALAVPSPGQLQAANRELGALVKQRDAALADLTSEITQRERAEGALIQAQKIDAVGQLTGGIAHDFNNLLQVIAGNLDLIKQRSDDPARVERWTDNALKSVERGTRLTGQLLAFSRTQRLELKTVDINPLVTGVLDLIERTIGVAIQLETDLAADLDPVQADQTQLELAILNLALNARDAMPDGGRLILSTRQVSLAIGELGEQPGEFVEIGVTDTGIGMPPEVAERAVEPFYTTKDVGHGTGLGLSMAFGIAKQSGGTLKIRTAPGEGTTVTILLRCERRSAASANPDRHARRASDKLVPLHANQANARVMIVDDDDDVRRVMTDTLEMLGYECHDFANGVAALAALPDLSPKLVVLDFAMPELNGAEVARRLRSIAPEMPIIFVSGYADSNALDEVVDARSWVLRKPFQASELGRLAGLSSAA